MTGLRPAAADVWTNVVRLPSVQFERPTSADEAGSLKIARQASLDVMGSLVRTRANIRRGEWKKLLAPKLRKPTWRDDIRR